MQYMAFTSEQLYQEMFINLIHDRCSDLHFWNYYHISLGAMSQLNEAKWHAYVSLNLAIIGSDNGLSPDWHQAISQTSAGILLIGPLGTNFK